MFRFLQGPANPYKRGSTIVSKGGALNSGVVEEIEGLDEYNFTEQYHTFQSNGYAVDPGSTAIVGDAKKHAEGDGS